jgi:hypothetical protein
MLTIDKYIIPLGNMIDKRCSPLSMVKIEIKEKNVLTHTSGDGG